MMGGLGPFSIRIATGASPQTLTGANAIAGVPDKYKTGNSTVLWAVNAEAGTSVEIFDDATSIVKVTAPADASNSLVIGINGEGRHIEGPLRATVTGVNGTVFYGYM